jgi:hypothetical protein
MAISFDGHFFWVEQGKKVEHSLSAGYASQQKFNQGANTDKPKNHSPFAFVFINQISPLAE